MAVHVEVKQGQLLRRCPLARLRHQAARATSRAAPFCWWLAVRVGVGSPLARRRCARSLQSCRPANWPAHRGADRNCGDKLRRVRWLSPTHRGLRPPPTLGSIDG
jgi:hypothetical protein